MQVVVSFAVGLVFGVGLLLSGMSDPSKVLGFLDLAGLWDPSLALVMAGAAGFALAARRDRAVLGVPMSLPSVTRIDRRLLRGALVFGVGWGLAGYCPGPAVVGLGAGRADAAVLVAAMLAGMALHRLGERARARRTADGPAATGAR